jgi:hypothetical protein
MLRAPNTPSGYCNFSLGMLLFFAHASPVLYVGDVCILKGHVLIIDCCELVAIEQGILRLAKLGVGIRIDKRVVGECVEIEGNLIGRGVETFVHWYHGPHALRRGPGIEHMMWLRHRIS